MAGYDCPIRWCERHFEARTTRALHIDNHPEKDDVARCPTCDMHYTNLGQHFAGSECGYPNVPRRLIEASAGLILSDGYLYDSPGGRHPRLIVEMANEEFLQWLDRYFGWLSSSVRLHRTRFENARRAKEAGLISTTGDPSNYEDTYVWNSRNHPGFENFLETFYPDGKKRLPPNVELTPEIARMWYVGDGGLIKRKNRVIGLQISSRAFDLDRIARIWQRAGFKPGKHGDHSVQFGRGEVGPLLSWMKGPLPGFEYKWR
jgi:hypothetical protein